MIQVILKASPFRGHVSQTRWILGTYKDSIPCFTILYYMMFTSPLGWFLGFIASHFRDLLCFSKNLWACVQRPWIFSSADLNATRETAQPRVLVSPGWTSTPGDETCGMGEEWETAWPVIFVASWRVNPHDSWIFECLFNGNFNVGTCVICEYMSIPDG